MGELRDRVKARWPRQEERAAAWRRLLESDALELLREGQTDEARRLAEQLVELRE
jgi:siroheme synthase (precorrin-2 oxidase/ferrochelatase)